MAERLSTAARNAIADALGNLFNLGSLKLYSGLQPASGNDAASGTLLCTITLPADAFAAASSGEAAKAGTWSGTTATAGTVGWFRLANAANTLTMDGSVTLAAGGGDLELADITLTLAQAVVVSAFKIVAPGS